MIITPGIERNETFVASITVDCQIRHCQNVRGLGSKEVINDIHIKRSPSIQKPAFAWTPSSEPPQLFRPPTPSLIPADKRPGTEIIMNGIF